MKNVVFGLGSKFESEYFNKSVYVKPLVKEEGAITISSVTFEPGCRNHWHTHESGQIMMVVEGEGYYQIWGESAKKIVAGDVVVIDTNVKHWHGATKDSWFMHIVLDKYPNNGSMQWLEPVDDILYEGLE